MFGKKQRIPTQQEPACTYCTRSHYTANQEMLLCSLKGPVEPYQSCKKFSYDPLRRVPRRRPRLPDFDPSDFELN